MGRTRGDDYAFPGSSDASGRDLTKREYFAALAMQGILANQGYGLPHDTLTAAYAVQYADSLIKALNERMNDE